MNRPRVAIEAVVALLLAAGLGTAQEGVLTQHNDNHRTGANLAEEELNTGNVANLKRIFPLNVDGQIVCSAASRQRHLRK
jgi:hypothetical protein